MATDSVSGLSDDDWISALKVLASEGTMDRKPRGEIRLLIGWQVENVCISVRHISRYAFEGIMVVCLQGRLGQLILPRMVSAWRRLSLNACVKSK